MRRLEEEQQRLEQQHEALEQGLARRDGGDTHRRARDVHRQIVNDDNREQPPLFARAGQHCYTPSLRASLCSRQKASHLDGAGPSQ